MTLTLVIIVIITALVFDFTNGFHDSANAMATSVATGAFSPKTAVLIAAVLNFAGASMSTEVAKTISSGIVDDRLVSPEMVFAGLAGAIIWNLITWLVGLPSSSSHAMFGGLIGAVLAWAGMSGIHPGVIVSKILLPALVAPVVAGVASMIATRIAYRVTDHTAHHASNIFKNGQRVSAAMVALAHGTSDGQKTMGLITLVLVAAGYQESGTRPHEWVIVLAGMAIALGTYSGGWRIMRTMGKGLVEIEPPQGFAAETASTVAILASSHLGFGLSTTHVCSGSILGSGLGRRTKVNWGIAGRMVVAWLLTLPAAAVVGAGASVLAHQGLWGFLMVLGLLLIAGLIILRISHRNKIDHNNVNESGDVDVLANKTAKITSNNEEPIGLVANPELLSQHLARHQVIPDQPPGGGGPVAGPSFANSAAVPGGQPIAQHHEDDRRRRFHLIEIEMEGVGDAH
jgi:PiT family inorganic phosphate transporter